MLLLYLSCIFKATGVNSSSSHSGLENCPAMSILLGDSSPIFVRVCFRHSLYDPVFTGGEVIFGCIDEGDPEVEHQIDDQGSGVLCQKDLRGKKKDRRS